MGQHEVEFNALKELLITTSNAKGVYGNYSEYYGDTQYIYLDALEKCDHPNNIAENSIYMGFKVDFLNRKVEYFRGGAVYLSTKDKEDPRYKYMVMRSVSGIALDYGVKKFRKQGFKSIEDLSNRIQTYYNKVIDALTEYTGGYPYKQGA